MDLEEFIKKAFHDSEIKHALSEKYHPLLKSEELAKEGREVGNALYLEVIHNDLTHERIWDSYLKSISLSPANSKSLALSYGNMSALLYHLAEFEACIKECDKALNITKSISLRIKLLCRKAKCYASLNSSKIAETFEEAEAWVSKISNDDNMKKELIKLLDRTKIILRKKKVKNDSAETSNIDSVIFTASNDNILDDRITKRKKGKKHKFDYQPLKGDSTHLNILEKKEKNGVFNSVIVRQDDDYSRYFVASKNIKPGEIIFVTKPLIIVPNFRRIHNYCNHCLDPLWSSIPCDNCCCCLWCSDKCKEEAIKQYHDIECPIISYVIFGDEGSDYAVQGSLRAVIKAVREFGSIKKLKDEIDYIRNSEDLNHGFIKDGNFKSSCRNVIALARFTNFFGTNTQFNVVESFQNNDETFFIATLLLQVAAIIYNNGIKVPEPERRCPNNSEQNCVSIFPCCERGYSVSTIGNFIPHCCDPSVKTIKSNGCKDICYALQPIYKKDPLLECYGSTYFEMGLSDRSDRTAQILNRYCTCIACTENWPPVLTLEGKSMDFDEVFETVVFSRKHFYEKVRILDLIEKYGFTHQHVVNELSKIIQTNFEYFGQPSAETCAAMCMLYYAFDALYTNKLLFPMKCTTPLGVKFSKSYKEI
ncbi:SET and MYND domain-containing protein 4-like isoform X2 [Phymastichus coffea]|uniref:SET and MYND domain-containing protein 4-like isoform X2 n=1 Tax=Phymastichus coffea TaxID=108790 RepID=UPI00273B2F55|nr:SET and MYND domain-containing protein 4-like isoform X2 [Phymastichus coffea]